MDLKQLNSPLFCIEDEGADDGGGAVVCTSANIKVINSTLIHNLKNKSAR